MTPESSSYHNFILSQVCVAGARARLFLNEIDTIDVALRGNFITADTAVAWLSDMGVDLIAPSTVIPSTAA